MLWILQDKHWRYWCYYDFKIGEKFHFRIVCSIQIHFTRYFKKIEAIYTKLCEIQTSTIFIVTACLVVSTEVQCFVSVTIRHFQLYIAQKRLGFDLDIEVKLSEGFVG